MEHRPTQEQIKELWKWCGFNFRDAYPETKWEFYCITYPDGHQTLPTKISDELVLDLNNLFGYAVPKLFAYNLHTIWISCDAVSELSVAEVWLSASKSGKAKHTDPALALFWAIRDAIHKEA